MNVFRLAVGLLSAVIGAVALFDFLRSVRPILWPTLRSLGQEKTTFFVVRIWRFTLEGWGIVAFEFAVLLVALALLVVGVYVVTHSFSRS
jgi:hypothetical protein